MKKHKKERLVQVDKEKRFSGHKRSVPDIALLFTLCGVIGIILSINSIEGLEFSLPLVLIVNAALCVVLHFSYKIDRRLFLFYFGLFLVVTELDFILRNKEVMLQLRIIIDAITTGLGTLDISINEVIIIVTVFVTLLLFALEYLAVVHIGFLIITTLLLLINPILGSEVSIPAMILIWVYQMGFLAIQLPLPDNAYELIPIKEKIKISAKSAITLMVMVSVAIAISIPFVSLNESNLYDTTSALERAIQRSMQKYHRNRIDDGLVSSGNNTRNGTKYLDVMTSELVDNPIYIRGFAGYEYTGGRWSGKNEWDITGNSVDDNWIEAANGNTMLLRHYTRSINKQYRPAYSIPSNPYNESPELIAPTGYYCYKFLESDEIKPRELYSQHYYDPTYTETPEEILPRLTALVKENPMDSLDKISSFIIYTINSNTEYDLRPGLASANMDIAEDFLFNRQKGYCVHYATVATLMYRMYGIPARYASGFVLNPDALTPIEFGNDDTNLKYHADITDYTAHAWVELYIDNYGWVTVDVTPGENGTVEISYPGFNTADMLEIQQENGWDMTKPSLGGTSEETTNDEVTVIDTQVLMLRTMIIAVISIIILVIAIVVRRNIKIRKLREYTPKELYKNIIDIVKYYDELENISGFEIEFPDKIKYYCGDLDKSDIIKFQSIVNKEVFSRDSLTDIEKKYTKAVYKDIIQAFISKMSLKEKLRYKWVKVYY